MENKWRLLGWYDFDNRSVNIISSIDRTFYKILLLENLDTKERVIKFSYSTNYSYSKFSKILDDKIKNSDLLTIKGKRLMLEDKLWINLISSSLYPKMLTKEGKIELNRCTKQLIRATNLKEVLKYGKRI